MRKKLIFSSLDIILTGQRIRSVIFAKGYRVTEIQEILHLACPQSVYRWLCGRALPTVDNLYMLSKVFDMHMEDLLVEKNTGNKAEKSE